MLSINQDVAVGVNRTKWIVSPILDMEGNAYDLTGASASWSMAKYRFDTAVLTKTSAGGGVELTVDGASGVWTATVIIDAADTLLIPPRAYYHELEIEDASGNKVSVYNGKLTLYPTVNRL